VKASSLLRPSAGSPSPGLPDKVARLRPDGTVAFASPGLARCCGRSAEELIGRPFVSLVDARDAQQLQDDLGALRPANPATVSEARLIAADGSTCLVRWTHLALFDAKDRLVAIHTFGQDATSKRKSEEDSARLAAIVAGAEDAIVSKTLDGTITSWNPAAEAMFGYTAAEAIGQSIALIIPQERLHEETEILARVRRGERTEHFETERRRKDGRPVMVSVNVSPVHNASGQIIGASKIARDITEQRRSLRKLEASVASLEALYKLADRVGRARDQREVCEAAIEAILSGLGTSRASLLLFDDAGVMRFVAWRGLSDRYRQAMEGHSPWKRDSQNPAAIVVADVLADPTMNDLREEITREGIRALAFIPLVFQDQLLGKFMVYFDEPRPLSVEELRLAETIGRHVGFGLARVAARTAAIEALEGERAARAEAVAARAEAEQVSRAKDEFLAMLAHELRNPMGVIVHAVAILEAQTSPASDWSPTIAMIGRQAAHLARLIDDLLDVARISSGRIALAAQTIDLKPVVAQALEAQRVRVDAKAQHLEVTLPASPVLVVGDPVRLQQVVGNLVNNASKYTPSGGFLWVDLDSQAGEAVLRVRDNGTGIPADRLDSIFELFVQANATLARTEGGLGVGLTLVRRVVELHHGRVEGHSEGLGKGAEFTVRLPLAPSSAESATPTTALPSLASKRILIVEDGEDSRVALACLLRLDGHEVYEAADGRTGLALAEERHPEIVIVDIGLPDVDGYEVGRALRTAFGAGVHLLALTGYGQPADREEALKAGFDAHLVKPVAPDTLLETLTAVAR
jgi:PAS domain S-box-containing protein